MGTLGKIKVILSFIIIFSCNINCVKLSEVIFESKEAKVLAGRLDVDLWAGIHFRKKNISLVIDADCRVVRYDLKDRMSVTVRPGDVLFFSCTALLKKRRGNGFQSIGVISKDKKLDIILQRKNKKISKFLRNAVITGTVVTFVLGAIFYFKLKYGEEIKGDVDE